MLLIGAWASALWEYRVFLFLGVGKHALCAYRIMQVQGVGRAAGHLGMMVETFHLSWNVASTKY